MMRDFKLLETTVQSFGYKTQRNTEAVWSHFMVLFVSWRLIRHPAAVRTELW